MAEITINDMKSFVDEMTHLVNRLNHADEKLKSNSSEYETQIQNIIELGQNITAPLNHLDLQIEKLGSTSNTVITAINSMLERVEDVDKKQGRLFEIGMNMFKNYFNTEALPRVIDKINTDPLAAKIEKILVDSYKQDTKALSDLAKQAQNETGIFKNDIRSAANDLKIFRSEMSQLIPVLRAITQKQAEQDEKTKKLIWISSGFALSTGLLLGILIIKLIG